MCFYDWSVIIPYYNEEDFLPYCLKCLLEQKKRPDRVILVNNGSSDRSEEIVRGFRQSFDTFFDIILLNESNPGKIYALLAGVKHVNTRYFATWDADVFYPDNYFLKADKIFRKGNEKIAAVMATDLYTESCSFKGLFRIGKIFVLSRIFSSECHAGGHSEMFNTTLFHAAGGFDQQRWPYVLEDHEIVQCLLQVGRVIYPLGLWCKPSKRRSNRSGVSWTKWEKLLYRFSPRCLKDWFFYCFLGPRFAARGLFNTCLREQPWKADINCLSEQDKRTVQDIQDLKRR